MSESRKAWIKGLVSGLLTCLILYVWQPEALFGEPRIHTHTEWNQIQSKPSLASPVMETGDTYGRNPAVPTSISMFKLEPLLDVTPLNVENVCISRAELDHLGLEQWTANITLKNATALIEVAEKAGAYKDPNNRPYLMTRLQVPGRNAEFRLEGRFAPEATLTATDNRTSKHHFQMSFNEYHVPEAAIALLMLTEDYEVLPCKNLTDLSVYNRWIYQWTDSAMGQTVWSDEWREKFSKW